MGLIGWSDEQGGKIDAVSQHIVAADLQEPDLDHDLRPRVHQFLEHGAGGDDLRNASPFKTTVLLAVSNATFSTAKVCWTAVTIA